MLAVGLDDPKRAEALGAALLATFASPFTYGAHEFHLTASIGLSVGPDDADRAERLIAHAESASFDAKRMGRNVVSRFVPAMVATPSERHVLHRELLHAIERGQLELLYQPIYDVLTGNIASVEALVRWRHPTLGMIVPDRFIPLAEESGLIASIGEWVISRVCEQIRRWVDAGLDDVHVSLNVSARQLDRLQLHRFIGDAIRVNGIDPARLEIEVTETSILRDVYGATLLLRELRDMGLSVAIDDFGAGFTSLAFLRDLPIDNLKIDRSFLFATLLPATSTAPSYARWWDLRAASACARSPKGSKIVRKWTCCANSAAMRYKASCSACRCRPTSARHSSAARSPSSAAERPVFGVVVVGVIDRVHAPVAACDHALLVEP